MFNLKVDTFGSIFVIFGYILLASSYVIITLGFGIDLGVVLGVCGMSCFSVGLIFVNVEGEMSYKRS